MAATACGKKSISPALAASSGKETLAAELKEVLALFNGDSVSKGAIRRLLELAEFEGIAGINYTNYLSMANYFSGLCGGTGSKLAYPTENHQGTTYFNYCDYARSRGVSFNDKKTKKLLVEKK